MAEAHPGPDDPEDEKDADVEQVASDTEKVFKNFVYKRLTSHIDKEATEGDLEVGSIPPNVINEIRDEERRFNASNSNRGDDPNQEQMRQLGKTLAAYGDEIQEKYHTTFTEMISRLNLSSDQDFAYDSFTRVAMRLFEHGISWGRILGLLCFGYEIAIYVIKRSTHGIGRFLKKIVSYVAKFVLKEKIAQWIAERGGWVKALVDMEKQDTDIWVRRGAALVLLFAIGLTYQYMTKKS